MSARRSWGVLVLGMVLATGFFLPRSFAQWAEYGPGARYQLSALYDSATNQMIVFGGANLGTLNYNDVWLAVDVATSSTMTRLLQWNWLSTSGTPPAPRYGHTAVYGANHRMIVFGGAEGFPSPCANDVWVLSNANGSGGASTWTQLSPTGTPPTAREGQAAVYDSTANTMTIFGGSNCNGGYLSDTWVLSNADGLGGTPAWTELSPSGSVPAARTTLAAGYTPSSRRMVVFGGTNGTSLNDAWVLSNANGKGTPAWTQLTPSGPPSARYGMAYAFDVTNNRLMIQGGDTGTTVLGDSWVLSNANGLGGTPTWTMLAPTNAGPQRYLHTGIFASSLDQLIVFGGIAYNAPTPTTADDHLFVLTQANGL